MTASATPQVKLVKASASIRKAAADLKQYSSSLVLYHFKPDHKYTNTVWCKLTAFEWQVHIHSSESQFLLWILHHVTCICICNIPQSHICTSKTNYSTKSLVTRSAEGKHSELNLTRHKHSTAWCFQCLFQHCHSHPHLFPFKKATCHSIKNTRRDKAVYSIHKYPFKRATSVICHGGIWESLKWCKSDIWVMYVAMEGILILLREVGRLTTPPKRSSSLSLPACTRGCH